MTKEIQAFAVKAYRAMKAEDAEDYPTSVYYESCRERDGHKYLDYLMLRRHWNYGEWVFFELGVYACTFEGAYLAELLAAEDAAKARAEAAVAEAVPSIAV